MMIDEFKDVIGKKIFVVLKSGRNYTGVVKEQTETFLFILDKFNEKVVINKSEVSSLEEKT